MGTPMQGPSSGQFLRFGSLVISKSGPSTPTTTSLGATSLGEVGGVTTFSTGVAETPNTSFGIDLSQLRFRFEVRASDVETPNTMTVRVYNAAQQTVNSITQEFDTVTLTAGYQNGNKGTIFQGDIKQTFEGRERNVDRFLDIMAGDGDRAYTQSVINKSFPANTTTGQEFAAYVASVASAGLTGAASAPGILNGTGGTNPTNLRGKTVFGMFRLAMADLSQRVNARWSIQNGVVTLVPITGYLPGQAVQINSATGMIGTPEQTQGGIVIRCYLNPLIRIGQLVQINNSDINRNTLNKQMFPSYTSQYYPATVTHDGFYRVLVAEHVGDTRGNDWYTELTCLAADISSPVATSVQSNG
jgi:hypothetical protein